MNNFAFYDTERFWDGIDKEFLRRTSHLSELRRSDVVVTYTRLGDPEKLLLPKMNFDQTIGLAFVARYLYEYNTDLAVFGMGILEAIALMIFKKYQIKERVIEEDSIFWFLIDLQTYLTFDDEPHWRYHAENNYANYAPEAPVKPNMFVGNILRKAFQLLDQISLIGESKPRKPQRRKGYNDKGSTRPQSAWKPTSSFNLDDDQNYSYQKRAELARAFDLSLDYVYTDLTDPLRCRGRSKISLLSDLNFKNTEREDDYYVIRKQQYPKTKPRRTFREITGQTFENCEEYRPNERKIDKVRDPDFTDGIARTKFRVPDLRNLKTKGEDRAIVKVKEYDGSGPIPQQVESFWEERYIKSYQELRRSDKFKNYLISEGFLPCG